MPKKKAVKSDVAEPRSTGGRVSQSEFPALNFDSAARVASALHENFGGRSGVPHDVALALDLSPTSSGWRVLCGASIAYGLTEGGYNADSIRLTALGRKLVAPEFDGESEAARVEAVLRPKIVRLFFEKYDRAKFPQDVIAQNVLVSLGLPRARAPEALDILKEVGRGAGIIRETKTGPFVAIATNSGARVERADYSVENNGGYSRGDSEGTKETSDNGMVSITASNSKQFQRVFVSHGKTRFVVAQIRELLTFGGFDPVISVDQERTAIPVPDKVFEDMRSCDAGVIHVGSEGTLLDKNGQEHLFVNQNVLIEVGAALALYGKRVILLVERGLSLPSNLQGLYRCEYEGDKLDYEATMKLLKTFNQFRE